MAQWRNVCFTLNNYTEMEYKELLDMKCNYIIIGKEVGESGTPHLQGYIEFKGGKRLTTLKKLNDRIHWEKRRGSAKQAADYCKKEGNFIEVGEISRQGKRTDLDEVVDMVVDGCSISEIAEAYPKQTLLYGKRITEFKCNLYKDRTEPPCVTWLWGLTGTGKTRTAVESHSSFYIKDGTMWWNGYEQQEAIIIDDFDGKWPYRDFLRLLDRYPYQAQYKGGYVKINSPFIYITCEFPPQHFWADNELAQVLRRITSIEYLTRRDATEVGGNTDAPTINGCKTDPNSPTFDGLTDI